MANRLASESSPYLRQHRENPVDWFPWGDEAFAIAATEDKPVFLSVGYSSCHWCHVMAHESFEDEEVARILNESFVCVKVDREERPDVDEAYMTAVQLSSGRGGWPMSVFLTPQRKPFFAGTYFPRDDSGQRPGFLTVCRQIAQLWRERRDDLESSAREFALGVANAISGPAPAVTAPFDDDFIDQAVRSLAADFDPRHGGFGSSPKFPPHTGIDFLLRFVHRESAPEDLRQVALGMALSTLEKMALGGIHDQVGGGFHRYSTDEKWLLPHFEKMLYDNALMLSNFALAAGLLHGVDRRLEELFVRVANGIALWSIAEMRTDDGLFCSALDADSEGEEGLFYVWKAGEVQECLGERAQGFLEAFGFEESGNFEDEASGRRTGHNIPHLREDVGDSFDQDLKALRSRRAARSRPERDDKAIVGWNGLMIAAYAQAGIVERAEETATAILEHERQFGGLPHQVVAGLPTGYAYLEDYAAFAWSLTQLHLVRGAFPAETPRDWIGEAARLVARMIELFWDEGDGGFFSTSVFHEQLFGRSKPYFDTPTPSGNALAMRCLLAVGDRERAERTLNSALGWMERAPQATEALYAAAMELAPESLPRDTVVEGARLPEVTLSVTECKAEGARARGEVLISIPEGLHINAAQPPAKWLTPTEVSIRPFAARIDYPMSATGEYAGEMRIPFELELPTPLGDREFEVTVTYQACTESECRLPERRTLYGVVEL